MKQQPAKLTREDEARAEMERTAVSPACVVWLITLFLSALLAVFIFQYADDLRQYFRGARPDAIPEFVRIKPLWSAPVRVFQTSESPPWARLMAANRALMREIKRYETGLDNSSWLARTVLPQAQYIFTRRFDIGNEKVYCGRKDHLFYRPDVDFIAGRGFLDPAQMQRRRLSDPARAMPVEPDPLAAIRDFDRELKQMGIRLIVMPVPAKPTLYPFRVYKNFPEQPAHPQNPSYKVFIEALQVDGIEVFDCLELLSRRKKGAYLKQDTHWLPDGAMLAAEGLARRIRALNILPEKPPVMYTRREVEAANHGDVAVMLRLPEDSGLYGLEAVDLQQVITPDQQLWSRAENSDVLLLGDSFANIYSIPSMNWGVSAGLVEQLSCYLQRPLDRITMNDNGAYATRLELARRQAAGMRPLEGKRIVIWEFAARELAQGDWKKISLKPEAADPDR